MSARFRVESLIILSASLQNSIRFFYPLVPAPPPARLAVTPASYEAKIRGCHVPLISSDRLGLLFTPVETSTSYPRRGL